MLNTSYKEYMNFLFCSVGRRGELIKDFKKSLDNDSKIIAADNSITAPALYFADNNKFYYHFINI